MTIYKNKMKQNDEISIGRIKKYKLLQGGSVGRL